MRSNKAVAVGAISFYLDHSVTGRIAKFTIGLPYNVYYRSEDPEHVKREHKTYLDAAGVKLVKDAFKTMLSRVRHQACWAGYL